MNTRSAAEQFGLGFMEHDEGNYDDAVDAFAAVDAFQFQHLSEEEAREAARNYVDALWIKDDAENGEKGWGEVREPLCSRAETIATDEKYALLTASAWRSHKLGGAYWTPIMRAQLFETRVALQDEEYPKKEGGGQTGFGPLPPLYLFGVEAHDMRLYDLGYDVMEQYFEIMQTLRNR